MPDHPHYPAHPGYVIGFHGTDAQTASQVVERGELFRISAGPKEWLGPGVYFWQNDPVRAREWAEMRGKKDPTIIGAVIHLGFSLYLMERQWMQFVRESHASYLDMAKVSGDPALTNSGYNARHLDCAVIQVAHQRAKELFDKRFDTVVGPFSQGGLLYDGAMLRDFDHMQICVANQNFIKGCFYERAVDPQMPVL